MTALAQPEQRAPGGAAGVKSAERAMRVLAVLARYARPVPTMALARECGIPKSSTHHLLNSMRAADFVVYYESERAWGLGIAVFELGSAYLRSRPLQRLGRPLLVALTEATGQTSHLAILHGHEALYLDKERPADGGPALVTEVGVRLPAHLTAVGQAILASLPDAQVGAIYGHGDLVCRTGVGVDAMDALRRRLAEARDRGWAYEEAMTSGASAAWRRRSSRTRASPSRRSASPSRRGTRRPGTSAARPTTSARPPIASRRASAAARRGSSSTPRPVERAPTDTSPSNPGDPA